MLTHWHNNHGHNDNSHHHGHGNHTSSAGSVARNTGAVLLTVAAMTACTPKGSDDASNSDAPAEEVFHADNDIAMTIRSLADAIRVGEPLDSTEYNFEGILTDGQGAPLYTDVTGSPGEWEIEVTGKRSARIRNLYLGDLLPDDLRQYVMESMDLNDANVVDSYEFDDDNESELTILDFGGGIMRFETRSAMAPNGLEGPLVNIVIIGI